MSYFHETETPPTAPAGLGWSCEFSLLGRRLGDPGHEVITRDALGSGTIAFTVGGRPVSVTLSARDIADIILGNRSVDLGRHDADDSGAGITSAFDPPEQRRHALRATATQPQADAMRDIVAEFGRVHALMLGDRDPRRRMRRLGIVLHLIQDSFSPAHTDRDPARRNCVRYIRNFGRGLAPREHGKPSDPRDSVTAAGSAAARALATTATRRYLPIAFKAIRGALGPDPTAAGEAVLELGSFVSDVFVRC